MSDGYEFISPVTCHYGEWKTMQAKLPIDYDAGKNSTSSAEFFPETAIDRLNNNYQERNTDN